MALPAAGRLVHRHPWHVLLVGALVAAAASIVRDLIHTEGTVGIGDVAAVAVTVVAGAAAVWALLVITRARRRAARTV